MTLRLTFALVALMSIGSALAQPLAPGRWWRRPEIVQRLALTEEQQDRLEAIFRASATELIDLKADVEKANIALRGELDRPLLDRAAIRRMAAKVSEARGRLFDREVMMLIEMRSALADTQWNRLRNELMRPPERKKQ
jgi:Spy/CpxP family protein refolding chaperone